MLPAAMVGFAGIFAKCRSGGERIGLEIPIWNHAGLQRKRKATTIGHKPKTQ
jgi:hypothetical protein